MEVYDIDKEIYEMGKEIFDYLKDNFKIYTVEECKQLEKDKGAFGVIYITQCKINKKMYIGQKKIDRNDFTAYLGSGTVFTKAVDKYGRDNFERIILEVAYSKEELDNFEIKYIELFKASEKDNGLFYNIALGGDTIGLRGENHPMYGKHHTEEAKERISGALIEKYVSEKHPMYGKHLSEEARKRISEHTRGENNPMYGKHHTEEARKKQSEAGKERKGIKNGNAKLVVCIFPDGRIIKDVCIEDLTKELGVGRNFVKRVLDSHEPYKVSKLVKKRDYERLKELEGIIIMYQEDYLKDYLNTIENANINDDKAS